MVYMDRELVEVAGEKELVLSEITLALLIVCNFDYDLAEKATAAIWESLQDKDNRKIFESCKRGKL